MQRLKVRATFSFAVNRSLFRTVSSSTKRKTTEKDTKVVKSWKEIPGKLAGCKGIELSQRLYQLYGPIVRFDGMFGGQDMVLLFDPEATEQVLWSEEPIAVRLGLPSLEYYRKHHNKTYDPKQLTGLVTDHGENWRVLRTKLNPIMMQPKTIKLYNDVLEDVSNAMVARLRSVRDENNEITKNLDIEMNLWALESIAVVALGTRLNCFDPNLPIDSPARKLIEIVHKIFNIAEELDFGFNPWRLYSTSMFKKAMKIYEEHESLTKYFIDRAMKNMQESKKTTEDISSTEKPILEKLLEIDIHIAHIMATDMLLAGVDTAANTAMAAFYLLSKNPEKQNKLREEILTKQTRNPYLRACMKESMRIMPVVSGSVRLSTKEYDLLGYKIPKDVLIVFSHQYMSIMEENYPKPDEFLPERWLAEKDDPLYHGNAHPLVMAPFGFGVRMCIGRRIAELEMETLISKVVENFQIDWTSDEPLRVAPTSLNYVTGPFHFVFKNC